LNGEWFEITEVEVQNQIKLYSSSREIESKRKFEIEWSKTFVKNTILEKNESPKTRFLKLYVMNPNLKKAKVAREIGVTRATLYSWIAEIVK
jgi:hypothetical protein